MESSPPRPDAASASASLREAEAARTALADQLTLPSGFFVSIGAAIAVQIATAAVGLAEDELALVVAGMLAFAVVAGVQLVRFRRVNGVWLGGLASRVVLGTSNLVSLSYAVAAVGAIFAAFASVWWLTAVLSAGGGIAYALAGRAWVRAYRSEPERHALGESAVVLALVGAGAVAGVVLLLVNA